MTILLTSSAAQFAAEDSTGLGMALTAMCVVFCSLLMLFVAFRVMGVISQSVLDCYLARRAKARAAAKAARNAQAVTEAGPDGEIRAAIFMALHEEGLRAHDLEPNVITIKH